MEKILLKNMGKITFLLGIIIFGTWLIPLINLPVFSFIENWFGISQIENIISTQYAITTVGAIFVFWYGYKKHEREKEVEIISIYTEKYNNIKNNYKKSEKNKEALEIYFNNLFNLWREEYYLYNKGYISEKLWGLWQIFIKNNINKLLLSVSSENDLVTILVKQLVKERIRIKYTEFNNFINDIFLMIYNDNSILLYSVIRKHSVLKVTEKSSPIFSEFENEIIDDIFNNTETKGLGNLSDEDLMLIFKQNIKSNSLLKLNILE